MAFLTIAKSSVTRELEPKSGFQFNDFGKINDGAVNFAPLTVISGLNNSGKSYLAYLYWAVMNLDSEIFGTQSGQIAAPDWFKDQLRAARKEKSGHLLEIDGKRINNHLNRWIGQKKGLIAQNLLNFDEAEIGSLRV